MKFVESCKKNKLLCAVAVVVFLAVAAWVIRGISTGKWAGRPRRSMISVDSRPNMGAGDGAATPSASGGRVRPYPCLFMPGGETQQTEPICNDNIPWFPPYNRGTWPERFPGRFSSDYAPEHVAPLNERFYQSNLRSQEIARRVEDGMGAMDGYGAMDEKKAKNSLLNSFSRAPMKGANRASDTQAAGNEGFTKTNFSAITFPSYPGMYDLRSEYASPPGTVPSAQASMSLAQANVGRTQTLRADAAPTPAHAESHFSANADLMSREKKVPKELAHLSDAELNALIQEEIETSQCFRADQPAELPMSPEGLDMTRDITTDIHHNFMSQGKGVLSRIGSKGIDDKISALYRQAVLPTEEEMEANIHANVRPTSRNSDQWEQYNAYATRPAVKSVLQNYNIGAYTNQDFTFQDTDGQTVNTSFGP